MAAFPSDPQAPASVPAGFTEWLQHLYGYHTLTIRQKLLTISQRYTVCDENEVPRFYVVRPPKLTLSIIAVVADRAISILFLVVAFKTLLSGGPFAIAVLLMIVGEVLGGAIRLLLMPYRDIRVFADEGETMPLLLISQDNKIGFSHWYTIHDMTGEPIARARRPFFPSMLRRQWEGVTLDGRPICRVQEDNLVLALLRRYLGPMYGLLRTNFDFQLADGTRVGEYNRKLTLTDQYQLNLPGDPQFLVDRRVVLSLAILLDTAEGR